MSALQLEITRKRLKWRATHRGIREMDILVGGYADAHVPQMSALQLVEFAEILEIPDQDLLSWATKQSAIPAERQSEMLSAVLGFRPESLK